MHKIGVFSYKCRYAILGVFIIFFIGMIFAKGNTDIAYTLVEENEIDSVFPEKNSIVLLYGNSDESAAKMLAEDLEKEESVVSVMSYGNTIGKEYTIDEMAKDEKYAEFFEEDMKEQLNTAYAEMEDGVKQLKAENYSLMLASTTLSEESEETNAFLGNINEKCKSDFTSDFYLIGNSPMQYEMSLTFDEEINSITLLTGSMHTILTSALIIVLLIGLVGYAFSNPTVGQICQTISKGAFCATLLIIFILPGILAVFDKLVNPKKKMG